MVYDLEPFARELNDARTNLHAEIQDAIGGAAPSLVAAIERFVDASLELAFARAQS